MRLGHDVAQLGDVLRVAHAGDDVLALGVDEEVAGRLGLAGDLVAAEGDARARRVALVAEDHLLDVDRGAPVVGDPRDAPVLDGALARPRVEDRADRLRELVARRLREVLAGLLGEQRGERGLQLAQLVDAELGVELDAGALLGGGDLGFEALAGDAAHDVAEHLHEASVAVPGEALVARARGEALHRAVVEAEVQDRVEHPRHRLPRARAHGDEQRVVRIAELLAGGGLEAGERVVDLLVEPVGQLAARRSCTSRRPRS